MRLLTASLLLVAAALNALGATWYVDNAAAGSNNGTSWANAWTNTTAVVWGGAGVVAGDTLKISGGTTSKIYANGITVGESGTLSNRITIMIGRDETGHNGVALIPAFNLTGRTNITIDGSRYSSFSPATSVWDLAWNTNNMGINTTKTNDVGIYVTGAAENVSVTWLNIGPHGTTNNIGDIHAVRMLNITRMTNWLMQYCWIHDVQNDGINQNDITTNPDYWNALVVKDTLIELTGDDGIQTARNGVWIDRCALLDHERRLYNGHPDQWQMAGQSQRYLAMTRSILRNKGNSLVIAEHFVPEGGTLGPMIFVGNVFYNTRDYPWNDIQAYGATFSAWRENTNVSAVSATWDNFHAVNNTIYYQRVTPFSVGRAAPSGGTRSVWELTFTNSTFRNNLQIDSAYANPSALGAMNVSGSGDPDDTDATTNGVYYFTNSFPATHNIVAGVNRSMNYHGLLATNANAHGLNNSTNLPNVDTNLYTFALASTDTVAKDQGYSIAALAAQYPELGDAFTIDLNGVQRGTGSGWDIGALEYSAASTNNGPITNGLLLAINFDIAPADDDAGYDDWSGNGNHGRHLGYMNAHGPSNRCPDQIQWTNKFTLTVETGGKFRRYPDGWDEYNNSGDYLAVTNNPSTNELWSLRAATILFWGRYDPPDPSHPDYTNTWNAEGNRRFLGAGYGYPGAWTIGLPSDGGPRSAFRVYPNTSATASYGYFNDRVNITHGSPMIGSSTNMRFYLVSWTNGFCEGYLDGVLQFSKTFTNSSGVAVSNLTIRGPSGGRSGMLQIGGDTHNGNPLLTYLNTNSVLRGDDGDGSFFEVTGAKQVPNHGWGGFCTLDDVRVYNRVLSTNEWISIMMKTEGTGGGGGPTNPPASSSGITITTATLNVQSNATINQVTSP